MKIQLCQQEIEEALQTYLKSLVSIKEDKQFHIEFVAGRGANGLSAEVNIVNATEEESTEVVTQSDAPFPVTTEKKEPEVTTELPTPKKSFFANM